jgi:L-threonylcarbamoyladenylate synthase
MDRLFLSASPETDAIRQAVAVLAAGGLVLFPTETVYGAGVDATNPAAVEKLLEYKSRREGKPLSIAVPDQAMAEQFVELNDQARALYAQLLPGPVTVVSKGLGKLAPGVESEFGTVGVRIPDYPFLIALIRAFGKPITATSANASGKKRPYAVEDALSELSAKQRSLIDLILDAGTLPPNPPSTVIDTTLSAPITVRQGAVAVGGSDTTLVAASEQETQDIVGRLLLKHWNAIGESGLIIALDGPLGAGKTVCAKAAAAFLGIPGPIVSPTYTYIHEYPYQRFQTSGMLYHADLWKIDSAAELERLSIPSLAKPGNMLVIEWWSQVAQWLRPQLPAGVPVLQLALEPGESASERQITIREQE